MALDRDAHPLEFSNAQWAQAFGVRRPGSTGDAYMKVLRRDPCAYCGEPYRHGQSWREIDHIHARAHGGRNHWSNYTAACGMCNLGKFDGPFLEWLLNLDRLRDEVLERLGLEWEDVRNEWGFAA